MLTEARKAGIAKAKAAGVYKGRKPGSVKYTIEEIMEHVVRADGNTRKAAQAMGVNRSTIQRALWSVRPRQAAGQKPADPTN